VNLVLHIDRVVLEGIALDPRQRDELRRQLEDQLGRRLQGRPLTPELAGGTAVPALTAPPVVLDPAAGGTGGASGSGAPLGRDGRGAPGGTARRLASGVAASLATTLAGGSR
jgi:hypothetical protein